MKLGNTKVMLLKLLLWEVHLPVFAARCLMARNSFSQDEFYRIHWYICVSSTTAFAYFVEIIFQQLIITAVNFNFLSS